MSAYSADLRERVVAAVDAGVPRAEIARRSRVSAATIKRCLKRRRERGDRAPGRAPGRPAGLGPAQHPALAAQVAARPDDTLAQHCATWQAERGGPLTTRARRRARGRAGITRKNSR